MAQARNKKIDYYEQKMLDLIKACRVELKLDNNAYKIGKQLDAKDFTAAHNIIASIPHVETNFKLILFYYILTSLNQIKPDTTLDLTWLEGLNKDSDPLNILIKLHKSELVKLDNHQKLIELAVILLKLSEDSLISMAGETKSLPMHEPFVKLVKLVHENKDDSVEFRNLSKEIKKIFYKQLIAVAKERGRLDQVQKIENIENLNPLLSKQFNQPVELKSSVRELKSISPKGTLKGFYDRLVPIKKFLNEDKYPEITKRVKKHEDDLRLFRLLQIIDKSDENNLGFLLNLLQQDILVLNLIPSHSSDLPDEISLDKALRLTEKLCRDAQAEEQKEEQERQAKIELERKQTEEAKNRDQIRRDQEQLSYLFDEIKSIPIAKNQIQNFLIYLLDRKKITSNLVYQVSNLRQHKDSIEAELKKIAATDPKKTMDYQSLLVGVQIWIKLDELEKQNNILLREAKSLENQNSFKVSSQRVEFNDYEDFDKQFHRQVGARFALIDDKIDEQTTTILAEKDIIARDKNPNILSADNRSIRRGQPSSETKLTLPPRQPAKPVLHHLDPSCPRSKNIRPPSDNITKLGWGIAGSLVAIGLFACAVVFVGWLVPAAITASIIVGVVVYNVRKKANERTSPIPMVSLSAQIKKKQQAEGAAPDADDNDRVLLIKKSPPNPNSSAQVRDPAPSQDVHAAPVAGMRFSR